MNPLFKWGSLTFCPCYFLSGIQYHGAAVFRVINNTTCPSFLIISLYVCTVIFLNWLISGFHAIINYQKLIHWVLPYLFLWDHKVKLKSEDCGTQILLMIAFNQRMFCDWFWSAHVLWLIAYQIITEPVHTSPLISGYGAISYHLPLAENQHYIWSSS